MTIKTITANSKEDAGSDTYELLKMTHAMADALLKQLETGE